MVARVCHPRSNGHLKFVKQEQNKMNKGILLVCSRIELVEGMNEYN